MKNIEAKVTPNGVLLRKFSSVRKCVLNDNIKMFHTIEFLSRAVFNCWKKAKYDKWVLQDLIVAPDGGGAAGDGAHDLEDHVVLQ